MKRPVPMEPPMAIICRWRFFNDLLYPASPRSRIWSGWEVREDDDEASECGDGEVGEWLDGDSLIEILTDRATC